jgi:hypothetical protein
VPSSWLKREFRVRRAGKAEGKGWGDSDEGFDMKHAARKNKEKKQEGRNASRDVSLSLIL